jgi:hypothetical protein
VVVVKLGVVNEVPVLTRVPAVAALYQFNVPVPLAERDTVPVPQREPSVVVGAVARLTVI